MSMRDVSGETMRDVVTAYEAARAAARWRMTIRLRWHERRARANVNKRHEPGERLDQLALARLSAVRAELKARGEDVPPIHQDGR